MNLGPEDEDDDAIEDEDEESDYGSWSTEDLQIQSQIDDDPSILEELNQRTGDEAYPDGRDDG